MYFDLHGNLVLFGIDESVIWTAGIGEHAKTLTMQDDGNLVLYKDDSQSVWSTGTSNKCHSDKGFEFSLFCFYLENIFILRRNTFKTLV